MNMLDNKVALKYEKTYWINECGARSKGFHKILDISKISFAVLGVTTNLVSIYVLSRKELINTFNQVKKTLVKVYVRKVKTFSFWLH